MNILIYGALGMGIIICGGFFFTYFKTLNTKQVEREKKYKRVKKQRNYSKPATVNA